VAASFQAAVVRMLVRRTLRACVQTGIKRVVLTGGVAANTPLRETLAAAAGVEGVRLHVPPPPSVHRQRGDDRRPASDRLKAGERAPLDLNAIPDLTLGS